MDTQYADDNTPWVLDESGHRFEADAIWWLRKELSRRMGRTAYKYEVRAAIRHSKLPLAFVLAYAEYSTVRGAYPEAISTDVEKGFKILENFMRRRMPDAVIKKRQKAARAKSAATRNKNQQAAYERASLKKMPYLLNTPLMWFYANAIAESE